MSEYRCDKCGCVHWAAVGMASGDCGQYRPRYSPEHIRDKERYWSLLKPYGLKKAGLVEAIAAAKEEAAAAYRTCLEWRGRVKMSPEISDRVRELESVLTEVEVLEKKGHRIVW